MKKLLKSELEYILLMNSIDTDEFSFIRKNGNVLHITLKNRLNVIQNNKESDPSLNNYEDEIIIEQINGTLYTADGEFICGIDCSEVFHTKIK